MTEVKRYDTLHQQLETLRAHFNAMQLQRNHHRDTATKLRTELEAARGLTGKLHAERYKGKGPRGAWGKVK